MCLNHKSITSNIININLQNKTVIKIGSVSLAVLLLIAYYLFIRGVWQFPASVNLYLINIRMYAVFILTAVIGCAYFVKLLAKADLDFSKLVLEDALIYVLIPGIIGARIYHLITDWHLYAANPLFALYIWNGGLGIYGAIIGGFLGLYMYCRKAKLPYLKLLDLVAITIPLGQIIGRFGNFANQELYGPKVDPNFPIGFYVNSQNAYFHPNFLYEQFGNAVLLVLLGWLYHTNKVKPGNGIFLGIYLAGYAGIRFLVDFLRFEPRILWGLTTAQLLSLAIMIVIIIATSFKFRLIKIVDGK